MNTNTSTAPEPPSKVPSPTTPANLRALRGFRRPLSAGDGKSAARDSSAHDDKENDLNGRISAAASTTGHSSAAENAGSSPDNASVDADVSPMDSQNELPGEENAQKTGEASDGAQDEFAKLGAASPSKSEEAMLEARLQAVQEEQDALDALQEELRSALAASTPAKDASGAPSADAAGLRAENAALAEALAGERARSAELSAKVEALVDRTQARPPPFLLFPLPFALLYSLSPAPPPSRPAATGSAPRPALLLRRRPLRRAHAAPRAWLTRVRVRRSWQRRWRRRAARARARARRRRRQTSRARRRWRRLRTRARGARRRGRRCGACLSA
jgi:hypothetical protein